MAFLAPFLVDISFDEYYRKRLGLTRDLKKVEFYHTALKGHPEISQYILRQLRQITKFDWAPFWGTTFPLLLSREDAPRMVKIEGFLNYGKVFLQDIGDTRFYIIANPDEITKILKDLR